MQAINGLCGEDHVFANAGAPPQEDNQFFQQPYAVLTTRILLTEPIVSVDDGPGCAGD